MARGVDAVLGTVGEVAEMPAAQVSRASVAALDATMIVPAELRLAVVTDEAVEVGAFARSPAGVGEGVPVLRRGSGGPPVVVGPGTVYVSLLLAHPGALVACDEKRIVNRYVRPLLRALTASSNSQAHYFGRDWVSLANRPVAWVGFAHDASSRRTVFEAFVGVRTSFALGLRASFLGKPPATLEQLAGRPVDPVALARSIRHAYARDASVVALADAWPADDAASASFADSVPWKATREEAIGTVGAGPDALGVFRVGGDLLVSRDALARLEAAVVHAPGVPRDVGALGRLVDETLAAPGVALEGVRSLTSVRDVVAEALSGSPAKN